jgi:peroxiredoxin Q/BCP
VSRPKVGEVAPDFTLPGVEGTERRDFTLSEHRGRKVVLAFYPGDFTPG